MSTQTIELEGFEIELASALYCDRGGDHLELVDRARTQSQRNHSRISGEGPSADSPFP